MSNYELLRTAQQAVIHCAVKMRKTVECGEESMDSAKTVSFTYRNWRGEVRERTVTPINMEYGVYPHHSGQQWFLNAIDSENGARRSFAMEDILSPIRHAIAIDNTSLRLAQAHAREEVRAN